MKKKHISNASDKLPLCRLPFAQSELGKKSTEPQDMSNLTWRIFRIMAEFVEGFQFLSEFSKEITVFGSARFDENNFWYKEARKLGKLLGQNGYTVITGGGPGIMEAANRGAVEGGGESVGINIQLPLEQRTNPYVKKGRGFHYFFTRKVMLAASAQAYVFFPGGFGTMDELFEMLTLIQTKKAVRVAVILIGKSHWQPLVDWIESKLWEQEGTVGEKDIKLFEVVDSAREAFAIIKKSKERTIF